MTALGVVTVKRAKTRAELPFSTLPLLFGIQQLVEGVLWLSIQHDMAPLKTFTTYIFTMFSHLVWPIYVPYAIALMEPAQTIKPWRSNAMWACRFSGIVAAVLLLALVATQPLTAVVDRHIIYVTPFFYDWPVLVLYIAATCVAAFFSSHPLIRVFGLMVLAFFFVSYWFYTEAFFSVWCFFAAIISLVIYMHFRRAHPAAGEAAR